MCQNGDDIRTSGQDVSPSSTKHTDIEHESMKSSEDECKCDKPSLTPVAGGYICAKCRKVIHNKPRVSVIKGNTCDDNLDGGICFCGEEL